MVVFSHRGIGFGKEGNSLEALSLAISGGFSVEVDLRLIENQVILSHDLPNKHKDTQDFVSLLKLVKQNPSSIFALHVKEDSTELARKVCSSMKHLNNFFLFATDFRQDNFIATVYELVGSERLGMYVTSRNIDLGLASIVDYFWLDEIQNDIYKDLDHFAKYNKKIICCSPEIFSSVYKQKLTSFQRMSATSKCLFGVCTDLPNDYA